jgi:hypothetical protein
MNSSSYLLPPNHGSATEVQPELLELQGTACKGGREGGRREREIPEHEHQRFKSVYLGKEM